jgi:predicted NAD/FAD-binding protein
MRFYELPGGNSSYIAALAARLEAVKIRSGRPVEGLRPGPEGAVTVHAAGASETFDRVVVATPAWTAARLLAGLPEAAPLVAALSEFRSFDTRVFIHGDASFMPASRGDWSVINHVFERDHRAMTEWSGHHLRRPVFRSWVPAGAPEPARVHARKDFPHLVVTRHNAVLQRRLEQSQGRARVWLAGMYTTDVDDHESALLSAVRVASVLAPESPTLRQLSAVRRVSGSLRV